MRYNDCKASYALIRETSDRLCREYGLSVIEHPQDKGKSYSDWKAEQQGQQTVRGTIRAAIDTAILGSRTKAQFIDAMQQMGFVIDQSGKYPKIKQVGAERFVRFKSLGEGYDVPDILDRIAENERQMFPRIPEQEDPLQIFDGEEEPVALMTFVPLFRRYNRALTLAQERPRTNRAFILSSVRTQAPCGCMWTQQGLFTGTAFTQKKMCSLTNNTLWARQLLHHWCRS